MKAFLCGKGKAAEEILVQLALGGVHVAVWSHPGAELLALAEEMRLWRSYQDVNEADWPFTPELLVSVGYLHILGERTLRVLNGQAINCHYSLLPRHRGRSPVSWAIFDGDEKAGVTWHWIDRGVDTGRVLVQVACTVRPQETQASLFGKLHALAFLSFDEAREMAAAGEPGREQEGESSYHRAGPPCGGGIDPSWPEEKVERFLRAMTYPPLPYARLGGVEVRTMEEYRSLVEGDGGRGEG